MPELYSDLYGSGYVNQSAQAEWMDNPLINNFATRGLLSGVQFLGETLGKPQAALFGALKGDFAQLANLIPLSDTLGITNTGDPNKGLTSERVGGRDLLRHYGLVDQEDNYGNFAGGLALDLLADPLAFVRGPLGALTKAGEAAQKGIGLQKTIIGRMKPPIPLGPQGGLFSITNKPWYAEMIPGAKKAENVYVAGVDDFGKNIFQNIAQGMDTGWSKATRYTLPGTDFSPLAWLRSAYEKGAGNVTGHAPIVDEQAKTLVHDTKLWQTEAREKAFPLHEERAATLDKLMPIVKDQNTADLLMSDAVFSRRETGTMKVPDGTPPEAIKILNDHAEAAMKHMEPIYGKEALEDFRKHGVQVNESSNVWNHQYQHRQQAGMGDSFGSQQMAREDILSELPGGASQIERIATNPKFSGAYSRELDPVKQAALKEEFKSYLHKEIMDEGEAQISKNWDRFRSIGDRGQGSKSVTVVKPGEMVDTPNERLLKELEASWGLTPKDQFAPDTLGKIRARGWGGEHKLTPANLANATAEDIAWMRDRKAAERAMDIVSNPKERGKLVDKVADYFLNADPAIAERGYFYHRDIGTAAQTYGEHMAAQKAMAVSIQNVLAKEAKPIGSLRSAAAKSGDVYTLREAIEKLEMQGAEEMLLGKAKNAGHSLSTIEDLDTVGVSKKLVDNLALEKAGPKQTPEGWISKLTSATRYGLTVPWPANLVRNITGETANVAVSGTNPLKGVTDSISYFNKTLTDAEKLAKANAINKAGIIGGALGFDQNRELIGTGVTKSGGLAVDVAPKQTARSTWEVLKDWAKPIYSEEARRDLGITPFRELWNPPAQPVKSGADAIQATGTVTPPATTSAKQWIINQIGKVVDPVRGYAGAMETAQHFQNNVSRHQQIGRLIDEGFSPQAAVDRVLTTQRDYMNLTPFEKRFMKNVTPFYSFAKQNLISQADMLSREPGRYNAVLSLLNSGRESGGFVPGYASSGTAIPLPGAEEGKQRFLGSLGLTQEDEMLSALSSFAGMRPQEGLRKLASGSNPALKFLFEQATGTQTFSGRKLDDLQPGAIPTLLTGGQSPAAARFLSSLASGTPAARAFSTVDRLTDMERRGPLDTLLSLSTGIRTIDVDQQAAAQIAARDTITKLLNQSEQYKLRENLVVDPQWKGREAEMPPEIAELFRQYQWLQRQGKAAVKEKQMAQGR